MSGRPAPRRRAARRRRDPDGRLRAVLALGLVLAVGVTGTGAYWSDQAQLTSGSFSTGRLDLKVGNPAVDADPPAFTTDFSLSTMAPGSQKEAVLQVSNAETLPFTYTVTASATNSGAGSDQLGAALRLSVFAATCTGSPLAGADTVAPSALNLSRPQIAGGASTSLCFRATLPTSASTDLQGRSTVVTVTLTATQVQP